MDKKGKFILTTNEESAAILIKTGFKQLGKNGTMWIFLNDNKLLFGNLQNIAYTDKLNF